MTLEGFIELVNRYNDETISDAFYGLLDNMGIRWCYRCGRAFTEGYVTEDHCFCSEKCYSEVYTEEEFIKAYGEYKTLDDVAYWCSLETDCRIADALNKEEDMNAKMTLEEFMREAGKCMAMTGLEDLLEEMGIRFCSKCGKAFVTGYYADMDYYCSDECRDKGIDPDEWERLTDPDSEEYSDEYYWSEWEGSQEIADAYNEVFVKQLPEEETEEKPKREWKLTITEYLTKKFNVAADSRAEAFRLLEDAYGKGADINGQSTVLTADDFESKEIY